MNNKFLSKRMKNSSNSALIPVIFVLMKSKLLLTLKTSLPLKLIMKKKPKMDQNMFQENSWENTPFLEDVEWPLLFLICPQMVFWWSLHQKMYLLRPPRLKMFPSNYKKINHDDEKEDEKTNTNNINNTRTAKKDNHM